MNPRAATDTAQLKTGLWLGLLGITIFALTLPMTRLAVGTPDAPLMSGIFIAFGRAVVAALLSGAFLWFSKARLPPRDTWLSLVLVALGVVFGFPLFTSIAMRHVEAVHASVMVGALPLATAVVGAFLNRQRPSAAFWVCALAGTALVVSFAVLRSGHSGLSLQVADVLLLLAMACAAVGYGYGGRLSQRMRAEHVICWALLISLPVSLPLAVWQFPAVLLPSSAWLAFAYVSMFSMWLGFFAWYKGLALGGTVRVSQVQLLQPFLGMLFAVPLLGERLDGLTVGFGIAVIATVFIGRRMPVYAREKGSAT